MTKKSDFPFFKQLMYYSVNISDKDPKNILKQWKLCDIFRINNDICTRQTQELYTTKYKLDVFTINRCICGHLIADHCIIENKISHKRICVGNCCVKLINKSAFNSNIKMFQNLDQLKNSEFAVPSNNLLKLSQKILSLEEHEFVKNIKSSIHNKYKHKTHLSITIEELERLLKINDKIVSYYYNTPLNNSQSIVTKLANIILKQNNRDLIKEYYNKYIIMNPSDENNIYTLELDPDKNPKLILVQKKCTCSTCQTTKFYYVDQIFTHESQKYDIRETYSQLPGPEYKQSFFYNINDSVCSSCFIKKYYPGCPTKKYILILTQKLCWYLVMVVRECDDCHISHELPINNLFKDAIKTNLSDTSKHISGNFMIKNTCNKCFSQKNDISDKSNKYIIICERQDYNLLYDIKLVEIDCQCCKCFKIYTCCDINSNGRQLICRDCFKGRCHKCNVPLSYIINKWDVNVKDLNLDDLDSIVGNSGNDGNDGNDSNDGIDGIDGIDGNDGTENSKDRIVHEICRSCMNAKKYIKYWESQNNYGCEICGGWNFRFINEPTINKTICWRCSQR